MSRGTSPLRDDGADERLGARAPIDAPAPALLLSEDPSVALGPQCARADENRVDVLAKAMEHRAVAVVAEAAGAPAERGAAVDAGDEVDERVGAVRGCPALEV